MLRILISIIRDEEAATMVEYALLIALIAMVAFVGVSTLGISVNGLYNTVAGSV